MCASGGRRTDCFFLEKKDILLTLTPMIDEMVDGKGAGTEN